MKINLKFSPKQEPVSTGLPVKTCFRAGYDYQVYTNWENWLKDYVYSNQQLEDFRLGTIAACNGQENCLHAMYKGFYCARDNEDAVVNNRTLINPWDITLFKDC